MATLALNSESEVVFSSSRDGTKHDHHHVRILPHASDADGSRRVVVRIAATGAYLDLSPAEARAYAAALVAGADEADRLERVLVVALEALQAP